MQEKTLSQCAVCNGWSDLEDHLICNDCWSLLTDLNKEQGMDAYDLIASESFLEEDCYD